MLPEQTYADPAALGESAETKPLLAVDVRQHKGEILPHLTLGDPGRQKEGHVLCTLTKTSQVFKTKTHTFKKQHNKTQLDATGPERRSHSKRKIPYELNLQSSSKSDVTYFEYDWYKRKKTVKSFSNPKVNSTKAQYTPSTLDGSSSASVKIPRSLPPSLSFLSLKMGVFTVSLTKNKSCAALRLLI